MGTTIFKFHRLCLLAIGLISLSSSHAQTLSTCRPAPPMTPNVKPGVNSITFTKDGKTLVVAGGDGKVIFVEAVVGPGQRFSPGHTNAFSAASRSRDKKLLVPKSRDLSARV